MHDIKIGNNIILEKKKLYNCEKIYNVCILKSVQIII